MAGLAMSTLVTLQLTKMQRDALESLRLRQDARVRHRKRIGTTMPGPTAWPLTRHNATCRGKLPAVQFGFTTVDLRRARAPRRHWFTAAGVRSPAPGRADPGSRPGRT